jgi:zinc protease
MTSFIMAQPKASEEDLLAAYDTVISGLKAHAPNEAELERIRAKMRSDWYGPLEIPISRASVLSHAVLFDGNAERVSKIPAEIAAVTGNEVRAFAAHYLVETNRTIIYRIPASRQPNAAGGEK